MKRVDQARTRVVSYYARPASFTTGGVNTSRQQWMLNFARAGIEVLIVDARDGFNSETVDHPRMKFTRLRHLGRRRTTFVPIGLHKLLLEGDVVYLHEGWTLSNLIAGLVCASKRIPFVVLPHGVYGAEISGALRGFRVRKVFEAFLLRRSAAVHLFFGSELAELRRIWSVPIPSVVAATGYDLPEKIWDRAHQGNYLAWAGRYDIHHKGIDNLFDALSLIPRHERPHLEMRGPDHLGGRDEVIDLVDRLGLQEWVRVGGELSQEDLRQFMVNSRGFVHVPRWEAFGRTIAESLALDLPMVLGDGAHMANDLLDCPAVRVVASSSPESIRDGLVALWEGTVDPQGGGRHWVQKHLSWPAAIASVLSLLEAKGLRLQAVNR